MENEAFDTFFLAKEFNDLRFEKVDTLTLSEYNRWLSYFRVRNKLEEREVKKAQSGGGKKHSVEFRATNQ